MINETNDKIRYTSFKLFLEKGYEATNIRDICKMVDIKPSSLYFYYKSKQELFLNIYDEIWSTKIGFLENILYEKFLLRYHLFPAEELNKIIRDKYNFWVNEENKALFNLISKYNVEEVYIKNEFIYTYKNFLNHQIINIITNNIKPTSQEIELYWGRFWNSYIFNI